MACTGKYILSPQHQLGSEGVCAADTSIHRVVDKRQKQPAFLRNKKIRQPAALFNHAAGNGSAIDSSGNAKRFSGYVSQSEYFAKHSCKRVAVFCI